MDPNVSLLLPATPTPSSYHNPPATLLRPNTTATPGASSIYSAAPTTILRPGTTATPTPSAYINIPPTQQRPSANTSSKYNMNPPTTLRRPNTTTTGSSDALTDNSSFPNFSTATPSAYMARAASLQRIVIPGANTNTTTDTDTDVDADPVFVERTSPLRRTSSIPNASTLSGLRARVLKFETPKTLNAPKLIFSASEEETSSEY
jgi:hypothetical protein